MVADNNDLLDDEFDDADSVEINAAEKKSKCSINVAARRRLEEMRERKELEKLLKDDFDQLDDIA
ncbi:MAG: hypothetical protein R3240_04325 [Gammaproteobacteria bacterium]|nr:hypothetical protein [Gammaproteobacteria bacterium]